MGFVAHDNASGLGEHLDGRAAAGIGVEKEERYGFGALTIFEATFAYTNRHP
jgi:hypothetical protein